MTQPVVLLAAGGTGGHMFPAQSVAENFIARGWKVILTTDSRGARYTKGFSDKVEQILLPSGSISAGSFIQRISTPLKIFNGILIARKLCKRNQVKAVIGFGGYPAVPALAVARLSKIPYYIHEQNAVLGRTNKFFQSRARLVGCGLWPVVHAGQNAVHVGNPIRENILGLARAPFPEAEKIRLLVFGGSQGASIFSKVMPEVLAKMSADLRKRILLTQQAREHEIQDLQSAYTQLEIEAEISPFFADLPERMAGSHFVIARSGASTLAELQVIGRGSMLFPLPSAMNDHQRLNAKAMVEEGAAFQFDEKNGDVSELAKKLALTLNDIEQINKMAEKALGLGRPNAAEDFVKRIIEDLEK